MSEKKIKTVGGQALIEGIMMRGTDHTGIAVRLPDGSIKTERIKDDRTFPMMKVPVIRGMFAMINSLTAGYPALMRSAELSVQDEGDAETESMFTTAMSVVTVILSAFLSIGLFMVIPTFITGLISKVIDLGRMKTVVESVIKVGIFLGYMGIMAAVPSTGRVFRYHGAEHKTIFCYEAGEELTVDNVRKYGRFHPRCGTSFTFITLLISIIIFSFIPWKGTLSRVLWKLIALPLVLGISYEIIRYTGSHNNPLTKILSAPGLAVQRLTVLEPDDSMIEVAIAALKEANTAEEK